MKQLFCVALCVALAPTLTAQRPMDAEDVPHSNKSMRDARRFQQFKLEGRDTLAAVRRVRKELRWHPSVASAQRAAAESGRPIVMIQALGDLNGFC
ncbi:MAG: hypothetical protein H6836_00890 [Planctomycetes bacterium]|nr:hypothetical protein [Planctomycetota bacterium]MCB9888098.1 hypothetical protein [Planctomycetota bacterium]